MGTEKKNSKGVNASRWPGGKRFALFLSHDVDQIHDREMWRVLADLNHVRRMIVCGEKGDLLLALRRIGRALIHPKPAVKDFATILDIEAKFGFRSTFFVLHDRYWARNGSRFGIGSPEIRRISGLVTSASCEIGVHGGFYRFNDADAYRDSRLVIGDVLGVEPVGIRNHLLRFSGEETWRAQYEAGFSYDATFGDQRVPGNSGGRIFPFFAIDPGEDPAGGLLELPLTVMDVSLFRYQGLSGRDALNAAWDAVMPAIEAGGLVTLLWHNNYFNEPEYVDWQWVYEGLLNRLSSLGPWCATGADIDSWWRSEGLNL